MLHTTNNNTYNNNTDKEVESSLSSIWRPNQGHIMPCHQQFLTSIITHNIEDYEYLDNEEDDYEDNSFALTEVLSSLSNLVNAALRNNN